MNRATAFLTGVGGGLVAWAGWRYYRSRAAEAVDFESRRLHDDVEIRQYPAVVVAETVADSAAEGRRRLRRYLSGANTDETGIDATTPIRTHTEPLAVAAPQQGAAASDRVRVGVYLPSSYSPQTAPEPTDGSVVLTVETPRTVAVRSVPLFPRPDRFERAETQMLTTLADTEVVALGSPFVLSYDNAPLGSLTGRAEVGIEVDR